MLEFRLHRLQLGSRFYILLPKLNTSQLGMVRERLEEYGFRTGQSGALVGRRGAQAIHVDPSGLCWSVSDPIDIMVPLLPRLLKVSKEKASLRVLRDLYFKTEKASDHVLTRLATRVECSSLWQSLRGSGACALTPDEHATTLFLAKSSTGELGLLTDFPTEGCQVRILGRKQFYKSSLGLSEMVATLRVCGDINSRNSYLPKDGILKLRSLALPSRDAQVEFFRSLGQWCFFEPN